MKKYKYRILIIFCYFMLTLFKLFTAALSFQVEEDMFLVIKGVPNIKNIFYGREDYWQEYKDNYSWYAKNEYIVVKKNTDIFTYSFVIKLWWGITFIIITVVIYKLLLKFIK